MNTQPKICLHCKWWTPWPSQPNPKMIVGDCRLHAPQLFHVKQESDFFPGKEKKEPKPFVTKFPSTRSDEFCGSFKPRTVENRNTFATWFNEVKRTAKARFGVEMTDGDAAGFEAYFEDGLTPKDALDLDTKQPAQP